MPTAQPMQTGAYIPSEWKWGALLFWNALAISLYVTWVYAPPVRALWDALDERVFFMLNGLLEYRPLQYMFAAMNHRSFDLVPGSVLIASFAVYLLRDNRAHLTERLAVGLFIAVYVVLVIQIFRHIADGLRTSPSLVLSPVLRLSELVPEFHPKDHSYTSFPADHATVFALLGMFLFHFIWKSRRWILVALFILFILPRMVAGAHWLTDIIIGAGTIIMAAMSIAMYTPLMKRTMPVFLWIAGLRLIQAPLHAVLKLLRFQSHP